MFCRLVFIGAVFYLGEL